MSLNVQQKAASSGNGGINLVIAGAGSGKTKTLVEKVKNIISDSGISAKEILILTFSRKAAHEIKDRIVSGIGDDAENISAGTFHSFSLKFIIEHKLEFIKQFNFTAFPEILDEDKKEKIMREIVTDSLDLFKGIPVRVITGLINSQKSLSERKNILEKNKMYDLIIEMKNKYKLYKRENCLIDFDDMIFFATELLRQNSEIRDSALQRYKYILVDEFQDTSDDNFELLKMLLPDNNKNLFVVGDDWQSIYAFRNARVEYIVNLEKYLPDITIHKLTINYRSFSEIVNTANKFIAINKFRTDKELKSHKGKGGVVKGYAVKDELQELSKIIQLLSSDTTSKEKDTAIIYRNNNQGDYIRKALHKYDMAHLLDNVEMMTVHASKGLEFGTVIIAGVKNEIFPDHSTDIEEERRLFYVALTRAKHNLHVIYYKNKRQCSIFAKELKFEKMTLREKLHFLPLKS